jgi:hypothetical protein
VLIVLCIELLSIISSDSSKHSYSNQSLSNNSTFSPNSSYSNSLRESKESSDLTQFSSTRHMTFRPVVFQPNGSFKVLKETGKLSCLQYEADIYRGRTRNELADTAHFVPGYTGFVRGKQHIAGRTFGDSTRRALNTDYREIVSHSPVPSSPQNNRKVKQDPTPETFAAKQFVGKIYHTPGYTGFVPGLKHQIGRSYGAATQEELSKTATLYNRSRNPDRAGFASTAYPRQQYKLDSNPLPGGSVTNTPPQMYVPKHLKYLRYMSSV